MPNWLMDAPPNVRKAVFALVGAVLLVLAMVASTSGGGDEGGAEQAPGPTAPARTISVPAPGTTAPSSTSPDAPTGALELPVSQTDIDAAGANAAEFIAAYASYRFDQDNAAWVSSVSSHLADSSQVDPRAAVPTGNVAALLTEERRVTTATAKTTGVLFLSESTASFTVVADKTTTTVTGTTTGTSTYEVSLTRTDGSWGVTEMRQVDGDGATTETD